MNADESGNVPAGEPHDDLSVETPIAEGNTEVEAQEYSGEGDRLQKLIARAGIASRRAAEEYITSGRITVNGHVIKELGAKANPETDRILIDGKPLILSDKAKMVVLLHKPRGYMTTKSDPENRPVVLDLLPKKWKHLHPVGRLDFDTSGVLLLTDDGELTHLLTHPSHGIDKVYHARVGGEVKPETIKRLESGVRISEGEGSSERKVKTLPARVRLVAQTESNALVEISLREGRNRQVRKMLEAVGHRVSALRRVSFAGIELEGLPSGSYRVLLDAEVHHLKKRAARQLEQAKRNRSKTESAEPAAEKPKTNANRERKKLAAAKKKTLKPRTGEKKATPLGERIRREWK